jgi:hypothetical protein
MTNLYNDTSEIHTNQDIYDSFNTYIFSDDRNIFNKLYYKILFYEMTKDLCGDIVECGVFKGTGLYTFLKLKGLYNPNSSKKVVGFDFFDTDQLISSISNKTDKEAMDVLFKERNFTHETSFKDYLSTKLIQDGFLNTDFELVDGDLSITSKEYSENNPGFKISLMYMDVDLEEPTYNALNNLWDNITKGGIVVFDEYGYNKWSESKGVDRFIEEKNIEIKSLNYMCPTAYIKKP